MAEINENEVLYMLTIPRFNMPDFGSLDEDYLCREDQLTWYVSEDDLADDGASNPHVQAVRSLWRCWREVR